MRQALPINPFKLCKALKNRFFIRLFRVIRVQKKRVISSLSKPTKEIYQLKIDAQSLRP